MSVLHVCNDLVAVEVDRLDASTEHGCQNNPIKQELRVMERKDARTRNPTTRKIKLSDESHLNSRGSYGPPTDPDVIHLSQNGYG